MRIIIFGLAFSQILFASEIPTLRFEDKVTWKQVFEDGFRPKHLEGLERNTCVSQNQSFWLEFKGREAKFKIENGRLSFSFLHDDFLSLVWHQGAEAITLEEGKLRAEEFRKVFDGYIIQEITMPRLIDPSGLVDAGNGENDIKARVGEYIILYGFDNSMRKDKPIIPHFYIAWNFPGMPDSRSKDSGDVVRPPEGYEWYSLDPKVNTPDPGSRVETPHINAHDDVSTNSLNNSSIKNTSGNSKAENNDQRWLWIIGLVVVLVITGLILRKLRLVEPESN